MKDRHFSGRLDSLAEQVKSDHQQLLLGLATERDATKAALNRILETLQAGMKQIQDSQDRQHDLFVAHFARIELRFEDLADSVREQPDWTDEITEIKARLDRLEKRPPAA